MDTPNTRSRRKREKELGSSQSQANDPLQEQEKEIALELDERPSITWLHDQDLRRAVLQATEDDVILPPTPTQKPRPISSRFSPSSSSTLCARQNTESDSATRQPPRKRQCRARAHRSLPTSLRRPAGAVSSSSSNDVRSTSTNMAGASSMPSLSMSTSTMISNYGTTGPEDGKTRLDLLLERIQILASPPDPPRQERNTNNKIKAVRSEEISTPSRNLRPRELKMGLASARTSCGTEAGSALKLAPGSGSRSGMGALKGSSTLLGSTSSTTSRTEKAINTPSRTRSSRNAENCYYHSPLTTGQHQQLPLARPLVPNDKNGHASSTTSAISSSTRNPLSPVKSSAPRIGLAGSQHHKISNKLPPGHSSSSTIHSNKQTEIPNSTSSTFARTTSTNGRSFRTPFLNPQAQVLHKPQLQQQGVRSSPRRGLNANAAAGVVAARIPSPVRAPVPEPTKVPGPGAQSRPLVPSKRSSSSSSSANNNKGPSGSGSKRPVTPSRGSSSRSSTSVQSLATTHKSENEYGFEDGSIFDINLNMNLDLKYGPKGGGYGPGSEGDHSFDSFDGIFEEGGEEIEMLLRTMDGSK
ncbi:hypothetical protein IAU59_006506 [Kwoniella sp. CBS 9459]